MAKIHFNPAEAKRAMWRAAPESVRLCFVFPVMTITRRLVQQHSTPFIDEPLTSLSTSPLTSRLLFRSLVVVSSPPLAQFAMFPSRFSFLLSAFCVCHLFSPFAFVLGSSEWIYPGHPTNWIIRVGGSFGDDVSPGAPYFSMKFYPSDVEIFESDTVTWVFNSQEPHTVSFVDSFTPPINPLDPRFLALHQQVGSDYFDNSTSNSVSSGLRALGAANYTLKFNRTGNFPYLCALHPIMLGTLIVRDWNQTLGESPDDVFAQGDDELAADSTYALGDFIKQGNLLGSVPYTDDPDGSRTWTVWDGFGVVPISAYHFYPGNGQFNITKGDRIKFINGDQGIHALAFQNNNTFIPLASGHYVLTYIPDSQANLVYTGGFQDYGLLIPSDPEHNNKTVTFSKEGTFYVFCTLHSNLGMFAQINVFSANGLETNRTTTTPSTNTTSTGGVTGGGTNPAESSTGTIANQTSVSSTGASGGGGVTGGQPKSTNSARASSASHPMMMLAASVLLGVATMAI